MIARLALVPALAGALVALTGCSPRSVEFRFAPPEGVPLHESVELSEIVEAPGLGSSTLKLTGASQVTVARSSAWKYDWTEKIEDMHLLVNGQDRFPDLGRQAQGIEIVTEVMDDGEAEAVRGGERLESLLSQLAASSTGSAPPPVAGPWSRREQERADWEERVHALSGRTVRLGETVETTGRFDFGKGRSLAHRALLTPKEWKPCGDDRCIAVAIEYATDPDEVARYADRSIETLVPDTNELSGAVVIDSIEVSGDGERLIDPKTLLVREERVDKVLRLTLRGPDRQLQMLVTLHRKSTLAKGK